MNQEKPSCIYFDINNSCSHPQTIEILELITPIDINGQNPITKMTPEQEQTYYKLFDLLPKCIIGINFLTNKFTCGQQVSSNKK